MENLLDILFRKFLLILKKKFPISNEYYYSLTFFQ